MPKPLLIGLVALASLAGWWLVFLTYHRHNTARGMENPVSHAVWESLLVLFFAYAGTEVTSMVYGLFAPPPYFEVLGGLMVMTPYIACAVLRYRWRMERARKT
ncbi:MAG: hypothetical protein HZA91_18275 [Verrucomicrobia bacterium]|nr:hypothetical protein [Verrucomicrobiota bacterium]